MSWMLKFAIWCLKFLQESQWNKCSRAQYLALNIRENRKSRKNLIISLSHSITCWWKKQSRAEVCEDETSIHDCQGHLCWLKGRLFQAELPAHRMRWDNRVPEASGGDMCLLLTLGLCVPTPLRNSTRLSVDLSHPREDGHDLGTRKWRMFSGELM